MRKNFLQFSKESLKNYLEGLINFFIFLPYFFSVTTLLKTLFSPWKNLVAVNTYRGFSFNRWLETASFNLISQFIGFLMRISLIFFFLLILCVYILLLPFLILIYLILLPFNYLKYQWEKTDEEKKQLEKNKFINNHLLKKENIEIVNRWFENFYNKQQEKQSWWKLKNLLSIPPLARDWAVGYTPQLDQYVEDLSTASYQSKIKTAYDREKEIDQIERILSKSEEANVVIVGEAGVGKHTIVDSLAKKIYEGRVNNLLAYKRILKLNLEKILSQTVDQKQRESLLESLLEEASLAKNVILLIENFDKYTASSTDRVDLTIPIEKYAKTNRLQIIALTEPFFYQKFIFSNQPINRIFEKVDVYEIGRPEAEQILLEKSLEFEKRYQLIIPYETIKTIIEKSDFFITHIPFPEKAIALLDAVCVKEQKNNAVKIMPEKVDEVLSEMTHIPTSLSDQMRQKLLTLEQELSKRIIQQTEAITKLSAAIRRSFLLLGKRKKPLATFLFLGPTGVGKTETAKAITNIFFGPDRYLVRFDMSNYQSKADIPNLIGSLETNNPGLLTKAIRDNPYGVLLLDEIEKADKDLINIFLTIVDEGFFTDGFGRRVDCKNLVIIATSNAGSDYIQQNIQQLTTNNQLLINYLIENHIFSPEFLNRFDGVIVFQPITKESLLQLAKTYIQRIAEEIKKLYQIKLSVSDQFIQKLVEEGYNPQFGARHLERSLREQIEDQIAKLIFEKKVKEGEIINL